MQRIHILFLAISLTLIGCNSSQVEQEELKKEVDSFLEEYEAGMVFVKGGTFIMGDQDKEWQEKNPKYRIRRQKHKVTLDDFYIHKYETPNQYFDLYLKATGKKRYDEEYPDYLAKPNYPATVLTWNEAADFCNWLASLTGKNYRLPTEAEWEYAARSGGKEYMYGTKNGTYEPGVNMNEEESLDLMKVNSFIPNDIGLYNMQANAEEWVNDWFSDSYFTSAQENNPSGPLLDSEANLDKVVRGKNYSIPSHTVYERMFRSKTTVAADTGFRCTIGRELPPKIQYHPN